MVSLQEAQASLEAADGAGVQALLYVATQHSASAYMSGWQAGYDAAHTVAAAERNAWRDHFSRLLAEVDERNRVLRTAEEISKVGLMSITMNYNL